LAQRAASQCMSTLIDAIMYLMNRPDLGAFSLSFTLTSRFILTADYTFLEAFLLSLPFMNLLR